MKDIKYSVVIPVYNEEGSVEQLEKGIRETLEPLGEAYEIIFVNDGSTDETLPRLNRLQKKNANLYVVSLEKNSGQTASLRAGFNTARGGIVFSMDGDLQNDPRDIPMLAGKLEEGYDVICGWRKRRHDSLWKKVSSKIANVVQNVVFKSHLHDLACTLRAYKKAALRDLDLSWNGAHRFIPYILLKHNNKLAEVEVRHHPRIHGKSKYKPTKIFKTIKDFLRLLIQRKI
ncbi:MAG: glycosyltransferase family 2 protein [Candidatus Omnitrophota bacterium]